ncbi:MAG: 4'-phosphopantetheinyl transferase superfamily protein [Cyanobacteriota bacterium]|nr:4'-phosphopantetheinyl transferase superfamily protein [Cyanobacteriota bacterium]
MSHPQSSCGLGRVEPLPAAPPTQAEPLQPHPWTLGQPPPPIPQGATHPLVLLLSCHPPLDTEAQNTLLASLSAEERQRHRSYLRPADQARFLQARAGLRQLLGHWLGRPPTAIAIEADSRGKPRCCHPGAPAFNGSHSGNLILLAFHATAEVGVDVEQARPHLPWEPIAERCLSPAEVAELRALPLAEQANGFLAAWCRLEARVKASGVGLGGAAEQSPPDGAPRPALRLWDVQVPAHYRAAAALLATPRAPVEAGAGLCRPSPQP